MSVPAEDSTAVFEDHVDSPLAVLEADRLRARGKALRDRIPVSELAHHEHRPAEVGVRAVMDGNAGRVESLIPLRLERMSTGPFAFLRGAAAAMAADLANAPATRGLDAQICGDAHLSNFGFYASPERRQVMDLNDFDEAIVGPFEYDLKRLVASIVVAGRELGFPAVASRDAVFDTVLTYRRAIKALSNMPVVEAWSMRYNERNLKLIRVGDLEKVLRAALDKASGNDSSKVARKVTARTEQEWTFTDEPPVLRRLEGAERAAVIASLHEYQAKLPPDRAMLLYRYSIADVAFRVVGVGSVGTRAYIALLHGSSDDPFVLQIKEARPSVLATDPRCRVPVSTGDGHRVVHGQRVMQTFTDPMLSWTTVDGRHAIVRTFRDLKGSIDVTLLGPSQLDDYGRLCGALLARAHARSLDSHVLRGYIGNGEELAAAMLVYAEAYADQTEADFAAFRAAI